MVGCKWLGKGYASKSSDGIKLFGFFSKVLGLVEW